VAPYKILLKANVVREYEEIESRVDRRRVLWTMSALTADPRPVEAKKLPEHEDHHRICLERYRVVYRIDDLHNQVTVFRIAHRRRQHFAR
jgi:mRNA-degrading endonuclease RelE of RelBE toxin-antitoxin system